MQHVATAYFLHDLYNILAKVQHGVCKINQLPWEYEKIEKMKRSLNEFKLKNMKGMQNLAFSIMPYLLLVLRSATSLDKTNEEQLSKNVKECLTSLLSLILFQQNN